MVITLGDASTRQGTVCDVDRRGTVALRKVRPSGAGAPTRAPLVRGERRAKTFGVSEPNRKTTIRRRRCGGSPRIFSRTKRFLARSCSPSKKKKLTASSSHSPQPRPPLIRGSDVSGARSPTLPSSRGPRRVSSLRTDRDPPSRLSRNREDAARFARTFAVFLSSRSVDHVDPSTLPNPSEDALKR